MPKHCDERLASREKPIDRTTSREHGTRRQARTAKRTEKLRLADGGGDIAP